MDSIVECDSVEQFLLDSILQCIKLVEGVSSYTKYDVQGLADLLKANKQFHQLSKELFIKYKVFNAVPPEMQSEINALAALPEDHKEFFLTVQRGGRGMIA